MRAVVFFTAALLTMLFSSCNNEATLQQYFVEKSEVTPFVTLDLPPTVFVTSDSLSAEEQAAVDNFKKLNVLVYPLSERRTTPEFIAERERVNKILENPEYQELMSFGSGQDRASLRFVGTQDNIEELVLFASQKETGFAIVRVIGKDMDANSVATLINMRGKVNLNAEGLAPLKAVFEANKPKAQI